MSIQPSKDKSDKPDINSTIYGNRNDTTSSKTPARIDGLGNLLFRMHSVHLKPILFAKEETSLQFYEHVGKCFYFYLLCCVYMFCSMAFSYLFTLMLYLYLSPNLLWKAPQLPHSSGND